jgi:hypothetical protein
MRFGSCFIPLIPAAAGIGNSAPDLSIQTAGKRFVCMGPIMSQSSTLVFVILGSF